IENDDMITYGIPALHFLMLCLSEVRCSAAQKQERLLGVLEQVGLEQIALVDTRYLTRLQRIAILLITVAMSNLIDGVVLNPNRIPLDMVDELVLRNVFELLYKTGKTVLFVGNNLAFAECVANRIVALTDGELAYDGEFFGFMELYNDCSFSFISEDNDFVMWLKEQYPKANYVKRNDVVSVSVEISISEYLTEILNIVLRNGIDSRNITVKKKSLKDAVTNMVNRTEEYESEEA
ncbi:MAG: hypothetical protein FWG21_05300, partial [Oscillospiraceae bacterium]|nr:hypothetical protein [Oscillospiraceae bacterium]